MKTVSRRNLKDPWFPILCACCVLVGAGSVRGQETVVIHADQPPRWGTDPVLVEELRIGALNGAEADAFGRLSGAAIGPDGEMVVFDRQSPTLTLFDSEGRHVRDIGGVGQGPGEYRQIAGVRITPDERIAIWDPGNRRISLYEMDGTPVSSIGVPVGLSSEVESFQVDTAGRFYVKAVASRRRNLIDQYTWIRLSLPGDVLDSLPIPRAGRTGRVLTLTMSWGELRPFTVETTAALGPYGDEVVGRTDEYALSHALPDGPVLRIERSISRVALGGEERAQWQALLDYVEARSLSGTEGFERVPARKPFFRRLWVDEDDRIWVNRYAAAIHVPNPKRQEAERRGLPVLEWLEPSVWDIIDGRGAFLGTLKLALRALPVAAREAHVWVLEYGEMQGAYLVRYRIEEQPR